MELEDSGPAISTIFASAGVMPTPALLTVTWPTRPCSVALHHMQCEGSTKCCRCSHCVMRGADAAGGQPRPALQELQPAYDMPSYASSGFVRVRFSPLLGCEPMCAGVGNLGRLRVRPSCVSATSTHVMLV